MLPEHNNNIIITIKCIEKKIYNIPNIIIWQPAGTILLLCTNIYCWTEGFNYKTTGNFGFRLVYNTPMRVF